MKAGRFPLAASLLVGAERFMAQAVTFDRCGGMTTITGFLGGCD